MSFFDNIMDEKTKSSAKDLNISVKKKGNSDSDSTVDLDYLMQKAKKSAKVPLVSNSNVSGHNYPDSNLKKVKIGDFLDSDTSDKVKFDGRNLDKDSSIAPGGPKLGSLSSKKSTVSKAKKVKKISDLVVVSIDDPDIDDVLLNFCIQGAKDIIAEDVSDHANLREDLKIYLDKTLVLETKPTKTFEPEGTYKIYSNYNKKFNDIPNYAYLAVSRAENEKQLSVKLDYSNKQIFDIACTYFLPKNTNTSGTYIEEAIHDGLNRLTLPSIEREIRSDKKLRADIGAIKVFGENLKNLLLTPPVSGRVILGFDPAFRTGCKLAVVDATGKFLAKDVIYPTPPQSDVSGAEQRLETMIQKYNINLIVIGNGTASRESEKFISNFLKKYNLTQVQYMIVSEAGASVYSASSLAQEEYPDLDVTIRGAISIAHRVQDALAELTKIDPKAIGVGQYQHDVDQNLIKQKLDEKVQDTVNSVGVDVNTASYTLLQYVAGLSKKIAQNIVEYRNQNGKFKSKSELKKVPGLGPKAYEQCVGFLRIKGGNEILDETGIHPENHKIVYQILQNEFGFKKKDLKLPLKVG